MLAFQIIIDCLAQLFAGELIVAGVDFTQECFGVHSCVKFFVYGHVFAAEFRELEETVTSTDAGEIFPKKAAHRQIPNWNLY